MTHPNLVAKLQAENARLIALLDAHGIEWRLPNELVKLPADPAGRSQQLDTDGKLALFRGLFRGRTDVYPIRWESKAGKSGYAPACANEWRPGVCEKPRIKCGDCGNRQLLPLTDEVVYRHLAGEVVVGIYPLLSDNTCYFLAVDFDEAEWRDDSKAFVQSCHELNIRWHWKYRAQAEGLMAGFSLSVMFLPAMRVASVPQSSVMPVNAPGSWRSAPMIDCFQTRTICPKAALEISSRSLYKSGPEPKTIAFL